MLKHPQGFNCAPSVLIVMAHATIKHGIKLLVTYRLLHETLNRTLADNWVLLLEHCQLKAPKIRRSNNIVVGVNARVQPMISLLISNPALRKL